MINIKKVSKAYQIDNNQSVHALNDINLKLPNQGLIFIVGKSGSGKSTLLNLLAGLDLVSEGDIEVFGYKLAKLTKSELNQYRNTMVGVIFQEYNLIPELNVEQNIRLSKSLQGVKTDNADIEKILTYVELSGYSKRQTSQLSGGQKQRVAIARALAKESMIMLADEPTGSLDSKTGEDIIKLLKKISLKQLVIIVSHDRSLANSYADQIIELKDGKIEENLYLNSKLTYEPLNVSLIKPKMPHKIVLNMSLKSLMFKMSHLIFSVILLSMMIALTAIIMSMESYSPEDYRYDVLTKNSSNIMTINKQKTFPLINLTYQTSLDDENINEMSDLGIENGIIVNTNLDTLSIENSTIRNKTGFERRFFITEFSGVSTINYDIIDQFDMDILAGTLPVLEDEIAISFYTYSLLKSLGVKDHFGDMIDLSVPNDLVGKSIHINHDELNSAKIVGIIDTGLNMTKYSRLLESDEKWIDAYPNLMNDFNYKMNYEQHNLLYVSSLLLQKIEDKGIKLHAQPYQFSLSKSNQVSNYTYIRVNNDEAITTSTSHLSGIYLSIGKWLTYNPSKALNLYEMYFDWLDHYIKNEEKIPKEHIYQALVYYYEYKETNETVDHYDTWTADSIYYQLYASLLYGSLLDFTPYSSQSVFYLSNAFGESGKDLQIKAYQEIIPTLVTEETFKIEFRFGVDESDFSEVSLLGIILDQNETDLYVSESLYETIKTTSVDYNRFMLIAYLSDPSIVKKVNHMNYSDSNLNVSHYSFSEINMVESNIVLYKILLPGLLIIMMSIFTLLFSQIIHLTIMHHIKQIGVLVASGFKMMYIFTIYFYASSIIGFISMFIGVVLAQIGLYLMNIFTLGDHKLLFLFKSSMNVYILVTIMLFIVLSVNLGVNIYLRLKKQPILNINSV